MSFPRNNQQNVYELVEVDVMIPGRIVEIKEELDHPFKGYTTKKGVTIPDRNQDAVKFIFELDGYSERHHSRWMVFSYDDRSNLYKKYLVPLVAGIKPYMNFDIQQLVGMEVQVVWGQQISPNGRVFQHVETIIPKSKKLVPKIENPVPVSDGQDDHGIVESEETTEEEPEIPF